MISSRQLGSSRGQTRRVHDTIEQRNFMCANVNRNDPVMRRFCQYIAMKSSSIVVVIRDAKTGRIVFQPPQKRSLAYPHQEWSWKSFRG